MSVSAASARASSTALAHAARQLVRVVIGELGEPRDLEPLGRPSSCAGRRDRRGEAGGDVLAHRQPREQAAVLVDRAALAVARDLAARRREVAAEQRRAAWTCRSPTARRTPPARRARPRDRARRSRSSRAVVEADALERRIDAALVAALIARTPSARSGSARAARTAMSSPMPIAPIAIMPHTTRSMRSPLRASTIRKPRPLRTAIISAATTTIHATPIATRSAVTSCGMIAGSVTWNRIGARDRAPCPRRPGSRSCGTAAGGGGGGEHDLEERRDEDDEDRRRVADRRTR